MEIMNLLDLLFPKKCVCCGKTGSYLCDKCTSKVEYLLLQICSVCYKGAIAGKTHPKCETKLGLDGIISFCNYNGPIKEIIKNLKYRFATDLLGEVSEKIAFNKDLFQVNLGRLFPCLYTSLGKTFVGLTKQNCWEE